MKTSLCYVDKDILCFTTLPLEEQWGDNWDEESYEIFSSYPYDKLDVFKNHTINYYKIQVPKDKEDDITITHPCDEWIESPYTVEEINEQYEPWLRVVYGLKENDPTLIELYAGDSVEDAIYLLGEAGLTLIKQK